MTTQYVTGTVTVDISADANTSTAINITNRRLAAIIMPAAWTAADIGFSLSPDGTTYYTLTDTAGNAVIIDGAAATDVIDLCDLINLPGYGWLKLESLDPSDATAEDQLADRVITLLFEIDADDTVAVDLTIADAGTTTAETVGLTGYQLRGIYGDPTTWDAATAAFSVSYDGGTTWKVLHETETDWDAAEIAVTLAATVYIDLSAIECPGYGLVRLVASAAQTTGDDGRTLILVLEKED